MQPRRLLDVIIDGELIAPVSRAAWAMITDGGIFHFHPMAWAVWTILERNAST
jgi:hypothetical protein